MNLQEIILNHISKATVITTTFLIPTKSLYFLFSIMTEIIFCEILENNYDVIKLLNIEHVNMLYKLYVIHDLF